ncbi:MAG: hypothetical protein Q4E59_06065 [Bacteroidales bacterium]|nr:hypothetical protein [Bacteroidales bacterium]
MKVSTYTFPRVFDVANIHISASFYSSIPTHFREFSIIFNGFARWRGAFGIVRNVILSAVGASPNPFAGRIGCALRPQSFLQPERVGVLFGVLPRKLYFCTLNQKQLNNPKQQGEYDFVF